MQNKKWNRGRDCGCSQVGDEAKFPTRYFLNFFFFFFSNDRSCSSCDLVQDFEWQPIEMGCGDLPSTLSVPVSLNCLNAAAFTTRTTSRTTTTTPAPTTSTESATSTTRPNVQTSPPFTFLQGPCVKDRGKCSAFLTSQCRPMLSDPFVFDGASECGNNVCMRCALLNNVEVRTEVAAR